MCLRFDKGDLLNTWDRETIRMSHKPLLTPGASPKKGKTKQKNQEEGKLDQKRRNCVFSKWQILGTGVHLIGGKE